MGNDIRSGIHMAAADGARPVQLYIYDLSNGLMAQLSESLTGLLIYHISLP